METRYCKVPMSDCIFHNTLEMDLFVRLTADKFIQVARKGESIGGERIARYEEKGIHSFYIPHRDLRKVLGFNLKLGKALGATDTVSPEKKKNFMVHTSQILLEEIFINGIDNTAFQISKDFLSSSIDLLTEDPQSYDLLEELRSQNDRLYAHSLAVSMYSVMMARNMGWTSTTNLFKLSFGGLLHDIGKKDFPSEMLNKPVAELTFTEKDKLASHPLRGKTILENLKSLPNEVIAIAYQHHENRSENGYPQKLKGRQILPMARVVGVANTFCNYALGDGHQPGMDGKKAIHMMEQYKRDELDIEFFQALRGLVAPKKAA